MSDNTTNNKRIAKNTLLLYARMLLTMTVSLYTSRVILQVLGVEDFGVYNVVGGIISMFAFINGGMVAATQRYITFEIGSGNKEKLKRVFSTSLQIHAVISILVIILGETVGLWFLSEKMVIPNGRMESALWVYQCSILACVVNIMSIPYNADIVAHEKMSAFAYISIVDVVLKLLIVYLLMLSPFDKLVVYAVLLLIVQLSVRLVYTRYCKKHFEECTYRFVYEKSLLKEMLSFAGWNFIGSSATVFRDQGVNIAINIFCGPAVNAARGISLQVNAAISGFVNNFMTALNPQIIKSYAIGESSHVMTLIYQGARLSFYMLLLLSLPVIIEANSILNVWLVTVPEYTVTFVRLVLVLTLFESLSNPLVTAMLATGKIRNYQLVVGGLQMLNFPFSYMLLYWGLFPEITLVVAIVISQCCLIARVFMLRGEIEISPLSYFKRVYLNILVVSICSSILPICVYYHLPMGGIRFVLVVGCSLLCSLLAILYIGCSSSERSFVAQKIILLKNRMLS